MTHTSDTQESFRSAFEQILGAMCSQPKCAEVKLIPSQRKPLLVLRCASSDYGAVLGKQKAMLNALKLLARQMGSRSGVELDLILDEDSSQNGKSLAREVEKNTFDEEIFCKLANLFCAKLFGNSVLDLQQTSSSACKLTVTLLELGTLYPEALEVELQKVFNCIGVLQGKRIQVELVTE